MLTYLFCATSGGLNTAAVPRSVQHFTMLEIVVVTDQIASHISYQMCVSLILNQLDFPVLADYFDEPDVCLEAISDVTTPLLTFSRPTVAQSWREPRSNEGIKETRVQRLVWAIEEEIHRYSLVCFTTTFCGESLSSEVAQFSGI